MWTKFCLPPNSCAPASQNVTEFGDGDFKEVHWSDGFRMGPAPVNLEFFQEEIRTQRHQELQAQREDHVKKQEGGQV